jgi:ABC-type amino acid transport substrate-binding protein
MNNLAYQLKGCWLLAAALAFAAGPATAQTYQAQRALVEQSHLTAISKSHTLRVCTYGEYFGISYRDPKTHELTGLDVDLAKELAGALKAKLEFVESSFSTFVSDLLAEKCDIGMFGLAASLQRAQAVEFSEPYIVTGAYAVARRDNPKLKTWADLDKDGNVVAVKMGSVAEPMMRQYLKKATVAPVQPPASAEQEVAARRADALIIDYAIAQQIAATNDWAVVLAPDRPIGATPLAYAVAPGDQIWLNYINLFVRTVKRDGRLAAIGAKYKLGPVLDVER